MTHLIDKDALVAEIERLRKKNDVYDKPSLIADVCYKEILSFLDTLEVKEVELEKEADEMWNYVFSESGWDENTRMAITHKEFMALAKLFFKLGLRVNNEKEK